MEEDKLTVYQLFRHKELEELIDQRLEEPTFLDWLKEQRDKVEKINIYDRYYWIHKDLITDELRDKLKQLDILRSESDISPR